jgi:surface protein
MFEQQAFNGDISEWDVSSVTNMGNVRGATEFNGDISEWDVSSSPT